MTTPSRVLVLVFVLLVATLAGATAAAPSEPRGVECRVALKGGAATSALEARAVLDDDGLRGRLTFRDRAVKLDVTATEITGLVVHGAAASIQGRGAAKDGTPRSFNLTVDASARTFTLRLSDGYAASGSLTAHGSDLDGSCPFDGGSTPVLDPAGRVSATIGREGGSLAGGGLTLMIPPGALSEDETITLTPLLDLAGSPLAGTVVGGAKLEPEGLRFLRPARLTFALPAGTTAAEVVGFGSEGDGSELHLRPRTVEDDSVSLELWHFSTAGGSSGAGAAAAAVASRVPSSAETAALQRIAVAETACAAEQARGIHDGPGCANQLNEVASALSDWYRATVSPGLRQALGAPSFEIEAALAEWLFWQQETEVRLGGLLGPCGPMQLNCDDAHAHATAAVADMAERRLQNCTGTSLASQFRDVARVADFADVGAIDLPGAGLPANMLRACAHLEVEVTEFPKVAALFHANTLRGKVSVDVYSGPDRTDVPFTLLIDGTPVSAAADGTFVTTVTPGAAGPLSVEFEVEAIEPSLQTENFSTKTIKSWPTRSRLKLVAQSPTSVGPGGTVSLLVQVAGDGMSAGTVNVSVGGPGSVSPSPVTTNADGEATTVYTAPVTTAVPDAAVTATLPDGFSATIPVTIAVVVTVGLSPTSATLSAGRTQNFSATVTGSFLGVTWSATGGAIVTTGSTTARYEAGSTAGTFSVTATSISDPTKRGTATVVIRPSGTIVGSFETTRFGGFNDLEISIDTPFVPNGTGGFAASGSVSYRAELRSSADACSHQTIEGTAPAAIRIFPIVGSETFQLAAFATFPVVGHACDGSTTTESMLLTPIICAHGEPIRDASGRLVEIDFNALFEDAEHGTSCLATGIVRVG